MIIETETPGPRNSTDWSREQIRNIPEHEVDSRRAGARLSAPRGSTRTIKVLEER